MKGINPKIITAIQNSGTEISTVDMVGYLICTYHNLFPSYLPLPEIQEEAIKTGLIEIRNASPVFLLPLYVGEVESQWEWVVKEYIPLFKEIGKHNPSQEVILRMKKLFSENPDIRVEEVIGATKMYIKNTENKYVRESRYFIHKGVGVEKVSDLLAWIEKYRLINSSDEEKRAITRKLQ